MEEVEKFLERLYKLANELENLGREFSDIYRLYDGSDFENQSYLASDKLYNSILAVTHEMASTIGFMGADIKTLTDFINFRKIFNGLSDKDIETIIDNPAINLNKKHNLAKKLTNGNIKLLFVKIQTIQQLWNKMFDNKKYQQVRKTFSTTIQSTEKME